jgi:hypothetical protein
MTNRGYNYVSEIVLNVMGFNDWLQDKEIVEPMKGQHQGGLNFTVPWLNGDKTRISLRLNDIGSYDILLFQYSGFIQVAMQSENDLSREQILSLLGSLYEEIRQQSNEVLDGLDFDISETTRKILKELDTPKN